MSANLAQAVADARAAEANTERITEILAVVQAVQAATQATAPAAHGACSCSHGKAGGWSAGKTVAVVGGGAACVCVLTGMFLAIALVGLAFIIGGPIGYLLMREIRKGK
jgi:hypothetical protein